jgi:hypothetical protein
MTGRVVTLHPFPQIRWVREAGRTLVVDVEENRSWSLQGLEAAIWDRLVLGYSLPAITRFLSLLMAAPEVDARGELLGMLDRWQAAGILYAQEEAGGDQPGD